MKPKIKTKSNSHLKNNNIQDKNKLIKKENNKDKNFSKKKLKHYKKIQNLKRKIIILLLKKNLKVILKITQKI